MKEATARTEYIKRFGMGRIIEHQIFALVFITLVVTGLTQRFHDTGWAAWLVLQLNGIDVVRVIHRYTGVLFTVLTILHIAVAVFGFVFKRWAPTMIINKRDFTNAIDNLKYYFGTNPHPARCGRYDYKQKFEYWGVILGSLLMIATGFALWFPTLIFRLLPFIPGQIIPAAKATHANECVLALLVIIIWHIYNAVFSPEVFPLDTAIFTGKISRERMQHEHPLEYAEIVKQQASE